MTNQELLAKIEEWVDNNEDAIYDDTIFESSDMVDSYALITYIRTLVK